MRSASSAVRGQGFGGARPHFVGFTDRRAHRRRRSPDLSSRTSAAPVLRRPVVLGFRDADPVPRVRGSAQADLRERRPDERHAHHGAGQDGIDSRVARLVDGRAFAVTVVGTGLEESLWIRRVGLPAPEPGRLTGPNDLLRSCSIFRTDDCWWSRPWRRPRPNACTRVIAHGHAPHARRRAGDRRARLVPPRATNPACSRKCRRPERHTRCASSSLRCAPSSPGSRSIAPRGRRWMKLAVVLMALAAADADEAVVRVRRTATRAGAAAAWRSRTGWCRAPMRSAPTAFASPRAALARCRPRLRPPPVQRRQRNRPQDQAPKAA